MNNSLNKDLINIFNENVDETQYETETSNATRLSKVSLDDQVDSFILNYERMSLVDEDDLNADEINEALSNKSLSILLEEDEVDEAPPEDISDDAEQDEDDDSEDEQEEMEAGEDVSVDEPEEEPLPLINIDQFVQRVARLATRPEHLLDLQGAIINRAFKFLSDNYSQAHVDKAKEILENNFDFDLDPSFGVKDEIPAAYGAGGEPSGGLGSGA